MLSTDKKRRRNITNNKIQKEKKTYSSLLLICRSVGDGFKGKFSTIVSSYLPPCNSSHRPIAFSHSGYPPAPPPVYYPPPVTPYTPSYPPPIPNYPYPPPANPISYPQIPNPAYAPPISYTQPANPHGGNEANSPAAENSDEPSRERQGSTSTEDQRRSEMAYPCFVLVSQVVVIGRQFCLPYPVDLRIARKIMTVSEGNFGVTDSEGKVMFTVRGKLFSKRDRRVLLDAYGNPLVCLQQKLITAHRRWEIFKGDSADHKDLVFSVRKSSIMQLFGTGLEVFMARNTTEHSCDYKVKGSYFQKSCTIYSRDNTVVAQMHKKHTIESIVLGKDSFEVTVYPNVDHAFIVALVIVLDEINADRNAKD